MVIYLQLAHAEQALQKIVTLLDKEAFSGNRIPGTAIIAFHHDDGYRLVYPLNFKHLQLKPGKTNDQEYNRRVRLRHAHL